MQQASCLEGGPLLWIWPLYLHVNQKSDDDDDDDDDLSGAPYYLFSKNTLTKFLTSKESQVVRNVRKLYHCRHCLYEKKGSVEIFSQICNN